MTASTVMKGYHWDQSVLEETPSAGVFYLAANMTSACNFRCPYCFVGQSHLRTSPDELPLAAKVQLMHDARACGARVVIMPGKGEPLIDPDFWTVLEQANELGLWVVVYTNGYSLDRTSVVRLTKSNVSVYLKVDSLDSDTYEALVGTTGTYRRFRKNLDLLLEHFHEPVKHRGLTVSRLGINSVVTVQSAASISGLHEWCAERGVYYTCRSPVRVGEAALNWHALVRDRVEELRELGNRYAARRFTSATPRGQCGIYVYGITVENNGEVYVCPDAREGFGRIGSIKEKPLQELIELRRALHPINPKPGFCYIKALRNPEEALSAVAAV